MEFIVTSVLAFVSTNLDDLFILTLFFGNRKFREREIVTGQLLGITTLILISLAGSLLGLLVNKAYIGLLGLFPLYLGIRSAWTLLKKEPATGAPQQKDETKSKSNALTVAGVTIANGGDNIGIYIPLFAALSWPGKVSMIAVFMMMTLLWCLAAKYFTQHPRIALLADRYGHRVNPVVLIALGLFILHESGTFGLL